MIEPEEYRHNAGRKPPNLTAVLVSLVAIVFVLALVILCAAGLWRLAVWAFGA